MSSRSHERKREAGFLLLAAFQEALGAPGPTALAAATGRSKSWWSKLGSGHWLRLPEWEHLAAVLPAGIDQATVEELRAAYRDAFLTLHDPDALAHLRTHTPAAFPLEDLRAVRETARMTALLSYKNLCALRAVRTVETLLSLRTVATLSNEEMELLADCLEDRSVYEADLGRYSSAVASAQRALHCRQLVGEPEAELRGRHSLGIAHYRAGDYGKALKTLGRVQRDYRGQGETAELVRALRDIGAVRLRAEQYEAGEDALLQSLELAEDLSVDHQYPTLLWLADARMQTRDAPRSRDWLCRMDELADRHPRELAGWRSYFYMRNQRYWVERHLRRLERQ